MHNETLHIIQRQTFLFDTTKQQSAYALQDRVSRFCREQLPGTLEHLFDDIIGDDNFIRIDKLEIDLGSVSVTKLEEELAKKINDEIEKELKQVVHSGHDGNKSIEKYSRQEILSLQFWFFLYNGYLLSWSNTNFLKQISEWLLTAKPGTLREDILAAIKEKSLIAERLIYHFDDKILAHIFQINAAEIPLDELINIITPIRKYTALTYPQIRKIYWLSVIKFNSEHQHSITQDPFLFSFYELIKPSLSIDNNSISVSNEFVFLKTLLQDIQQSPLFILSEWNERLENTLNTILIKIKTVNKEQAFNQILRQQKHKAETQSSPENTLPGISEDKNVFVKDDKTITPENKPFEKRRDVKKRDEDEAMYVDYAGIVLLHPFLNTLFGEMELVKETKWINEEAQQKAVQVLAYLAQHEDYCPEYKMPLLKFLCGLEFEDFVAPDIVLTDAEKTMTEELMQAVIKYWTAIGNVSATGLRESFLQREGKLIVVEEGWRLTVERKTIDILINKLPWGISFIKLPWLQQKLFVDWV